MNHVESSGNSHTATPTLSANAKACLDASRACAVANLACAKACAAEKDPSHLQACIRLDQDCASVTTALADVLTRGSATNPALLNALLAASIAATSACAKECDIHGKSGMAHCTTCAEACRACEKACVQMKGGAHA